MTGGRKKALTVGRNVGAVLGGIVFLTSGIVPAFYFGSFGSVALLSHLAGGPLEPGILVRMFTVVGILLGMVCVASVSVVVGSILGTALGYLSDVMAAIFAPGTGQSGALASNK